MQKARGTARKNRSGARDALRRARSLLPPRQRGRQKVRRGPWRGPWRERVSGRATTLAGAAWALCWRAPGRATMQPVQRRTAAPARRAVGVPREGIGTRRAQQSSAGRAEAKALSARTPTHTHLRDARRCRCQYKNPSSMRSIVFEAHRADTQQHNSDVLLSSPCSAWPLVNYYFYSYYFTLVIWGYCFA